MISTTVAAAQFSLSAANTYTGGTTLDAGTLNITNPKSLGANGSAMTFTINGGTLDNTTGAANALTGNFAQIWNGSFSYGSASSSGTLTMGAGAITLVAANLTITDNGAQNLVENGNATGTSNLTFSDAAAGGITMGGSVNNTGTITNSGGGGGNHHL